MRKRPDITRRGIRAGYRLSSSPFVGPLDAVGSAPFAASVSHRLYSSYMGNAFLLRRASDNATTQIPFLASGLVDQAAIAAHCTTSDGFVVTLYDQGGGARDVTQATTTRQNKIYDGATQLVLKQGQLPWISQTGLASGGPGYGRGDSLGLSGATAITFSGFAAYVIDAQPRSFMNIGVGAASYMVGIDASTRMFHWVVLGNGSRHFDDSPAASTAAGWTHILAAGGQVGASVCRQDGVVLAQAAVTNGTVTLNLTTQQFRVMLGTESAGDRGFSGGACYWSAWGTALSGAALTAEEAFKAQLKAISV